MKYSIIAVLIVFLAVAGCQKPIEDSQIITVDMTGNLNTMSLHLNDYVSDLKVTRLETDDNAIIGYFSGYVGEKYIISVEREKVLLFKSDGAFICTIAKEGKGPGEYTQIDAWTVDENENYFLYHDVGKNYIYHYDLANQQLSEPIPFENHGYLSHMVPTNDTLLSIVPSYFSEYGYRFFNQTISGQITGGISKGNVTHSGILTGKSSVLKQKNDHSIVFQPSESDTVFKIQGLEMSPVYNLLVEDPQKSGNTAKGLFASYLHEDENLLLVSKRRFESEATSNYSTVSIYNPQYIVFDLHTGRTSEIDHFSLDLLDMKLDVSELSFPTGNQVLITYQALRFKSIIEDAIKSKKVTGAQKERLEQLNSEISEYDNPILITGKWK